MQWFIENRPELSDNVADMEAEGVESRRLLAVVNRERLERILHRLLDEQEFLGPHGIRSLSKYHRDQPYVLSMDGTEFCVDYDPAESRSGLFGGNSNWRGPVWFPLNFLIIEALQNFHFYFGDEYRVEFPTGSDRKLTLWEVASELSHRLTGIFERDQAGRRPFNGGTTLFQQDPHFRNLSLFHEYFNGDDGAGLGASHQTGWTGLAAKLIQQMSEYEATGKSPLEWRYEAAPSARTFANS
jgi:hypothetical protein